MENEAKNIIEQVCRIIHGKEDIVCLTLSAILAGGHVLLEDIPGVGKTTMAMGFAKTLSMDYKRVQFTPDVLPGDLVGFNMYDKSAGEFRFVPGCVYTNLLLADEINRTSPKTQSALLEAMEERKATVEGVTRPLPKPFFVIATQNPFGSSGTQRLPESQLDRFMVCLSIGYPDKKSAVNILKGDSLKDLTGLEGLTDTEGLIRMQQVVSSLHVEDNIYDYIVDITERTRDNDIFDLGLSPRGSIALLKMARAYAYVNGFSYVTPDHVKAVLLPVAIHRLKLSGKAKAAGLTVQNALKNIISDTPVPGTGYAK